MTWFLQRARTREPEKNEGISRLLRGLQVEPGPVARNENKGPSEGSDAASKTIAKDECCF